MVADLQTVENYDFKVSGYRGSIQYWVFWALFTGILLFACPVFLFYSHAGWGQWVLGGRPGPDQVLVQVQGRVSTSMGHQGGGLVILMGGQVTLMRRLSLGPGPTDGLGLESHPDEERSDSELLDTDSEYTMS